MNIQISNIPKNAQNSQFPKHNHSPNALENAFTDNSQKQTQLNTRYAASLKSIPVIFPSNLGQLHELYSAASTKVAQETLQADRSLTAILGSDRAEIVKSILEVHYIRDTLLKALKLIDENQNEKAKIFINAQINKNEEKHQKALRAIEHVITLLIQWKGQYLQLEKDLNTNSDASNTAQIEELLAHFLRDIRKTARGLIGIVAFSNPEEIKPLQLIVNLSANSSSMRPKISHDTPFQIYLTELRIEIAIEKLKARKNKLKEEDEKARTKINAFKDVGVHNKHHEKSLYINRIYKEIKESEKSVIFQLAADLIKKYKENLNFPKLQKGVNQGAQKIITEMEKECTAYGDKVFTEHVLSTLRKK